MALALPLGSLPSLPSLPGLPGLPGTPDPSASGSGNANAGGANGLTAAFATGTLGLDSLTGLTGGLGGLGGGLGGGTGSASNGSVYGTSDGVLGGILFQSEQATYGIPILGEFVSGATNSQGETGGFQNIVNTVLLGTPLGDPVQGIIGGSTYGDEAVLYQPSVQPIALTSGLPVVNDVVRSFERGDFAGPTAFIGAYSGGLLSEDYLQGFITESGQLGSGANAVEAVLKQLPGTSMIFNGSDLNGTLDLLTYALDAGPSPYSYDLVGAVGGGEALNQSLPFEHVIAGLAPVQTSGLLSPVGEVFFQALQPIATNVQEVQIAGPIALGVLGKVFGT